VIPRSRRNLFSFGENDNTGPTGPRQTSPLFSLTHTTICMYVYFCRTYERAVSGKGEREKGGHVLRDTTSRGLCVRVWPPSPLVPLNKLFSSSSSSSPSPPPPPPPPPPPTTHNKCTPPLPSAGHLAGTGEEGQLLDNLRRRESRRSISTRTTWGPPCPLGATH